MTDQPNPKPNGGARPGAGRPKGARNKRPTLAAQYEARLHALVDPEFDATVRELVRLALGAVKETDRLKAIQMLHDRMMGKTPDVLEVIGGDSDGVDTEALIKAWLQDE